MSVLNRALHILCLAVLLTTSARADHDRTSVGDALNPGAVFGKIVVTPGASPNAAARTLAELKKILADKVNDGELSQADADRILSRYGGVLVVYAQGSNGRSPVKVAPPTTVKVIQAAPAPTEAPASAVPPPITTASSAKPDFGAMPAVSVNVNAFNELALVLGSRRRMKERANAFAREGSSEAGGSESTGGWASFAGAGEEGRAIFDRGAVRRAPASGNETKDLKIVSGRPRGTRVNMADESSRGTKLSAGQRFKRLAGFEQVTDENGEPAQSESGLPYPPWLNWFFSTILAMLFARAGYQYHRGLRGL